MWVKGAKFRAMGRRTSYQSLETDIRALSAFCFIWGKTEMYKKTLNCKATTGIFMELPVCLYVCFAFQNV